MRPNILFLFPDQQRQDSLGCYGNCFTHTPNIDRLAQEGVRFDECYTPWPVCTPARATMWTGVYPHDHGIIRNVYGVDNALREISSRKTTVFDLVQETGYMTAYFGKWHLGEADPGMFDLWDGYNSLGGHWVDGKQGGTYKSDVQTDHLVKFLKGQAGADRPFFAVSSYYPPHDPYTAPREFYEYYRGRGVPHPGYYAAVTAIDHSIGRILDALEEAGLRENTVVIFYSDHGDTFHYREDYDKKGEHKFVCHEEAIHVPLIIRWPGQIAEDTVLDCFVGLQDLMPTVLELAGAESPEYLQGESLVPWLRGETPDWREWYYVENETRWNRYPQRCIRTRDWKLIVCEGGANSLYNLQEDPEEELDIYDTPREDPHNRFLHFPSYTDVITDLAEQLKSYAQRINDDLGVRMADQALEEMESRRQAEKQGIRSKGKR